MRRGVLCAPLVADKGITISCKRKLSKLSHSHSPTMCDLPECLANGVNVLESIEIRAATYFVKMMERKKIVRNRFSSFGSTILILLVVLRQTVFVLFSRSAE